MVTSSESVPQPSALGLFERWLSIWVALAIGAGLLLGNLAPGLFAALASVEYASVNLIVAALIWAMIFPMMVAIDFASLRDIGNKREEFYTMIVVAGFAMWHMGVAFVVGVILDNALRRKWIRL